MSAGVPETVRPEKPSSSMIDQNGWIGPDGKFKPMGKIRDPGYISHEGTSREIGFKGKNNALDSGAVRVVHIPGINGASDTIGFQLRADKPASTDIVRKALADVPKEFDVSVEYREGAENSYQKGTKAEVLRWLDSRSSPSSISEYSQRRDSSESKMDRAELNSWQSAADSVLKGDTATEEMRAKARESASIANIASARMGSKTDTVTLRRGKRILGVMQLGSSGVEKGSPMTIDWLSVHPDVLLGRVAEKGIGTELMQHAVKRAADLGVGIELNSAEGARGFYERFGMQLGKGGSVLQFFLTPEQVKTLAEKPQK